MRLPDYRMMKPAFRRRSCRRRGLLRSTAKNDRKPDGRAPSIVNFRQVERRVAADGGALGGQPGLGVFAAVVVPLLVAGGSEASVNPIAIAGFTNCMALSETNEPMASSLPFDSRRKGFVLGEGAGVLVLEEYEHAKARGAKIYAELSGYGMSADAGHMTAPNMDGPRRAMLNAMRNAGVNPDQIHYLNAHGTSTPLGDKNETNAIKAALGDAAYQTVVSSTKSMTGHLLGGAGGIESVFTVMALHTQKIPPTINLFNQDPECDLDYCANTARDAKIEVALKNNFGFGGTNGSLVFKRV